MDLVTTTSSNELFLFERLYENSPQQNNIKQRIKRVIFSDDDV
jgi:hypothetical protein